jgi:thymidylate synthase (FAD)
MKHQKVLNGGYITLVDSMGDDHSVLKAARVSYGLEGKTGQNQEADAKLIQYLLKNKHTSPFEHVTFTFEVKAPIFVFRQWHRHRTWSFNEISARYTELPEDFYIPSITQITKQHDSNKQMRTDEINPDAGIIQEIMKAACEDAFTRYKTLLSYGTPRELARCVLPVATYSRMAATVDLHNLLHFLNLRLHEHAQYEIRVYAEAILEMITEVVPMTVAAWAGLKE